MSKEPQFPDDLTYRTKDIRGCLPNYIMIGRILLHNGNSRFYQITGFCWLGATDEWGYLHQEVRSDALPGITIARPLAHLHSYLSNGDKRYTLVNEIAEEH